MLNYYTLQTELKLWQVVSFISGACLLLAVIIMFIKDKQINDYQNQAIACRNDNAQIKANVEKLVKSLTGEKPDVEIMLIPTELKNI